MTNKYNYRKIEINNDSILLIPYSDDKIYTQKTNTVSLSILPHISAEKLYINNIKLSKLNKDITFDVKNLYLENIIPDTAGINLTGCRSVTVSFSPHCPANKFIIATKQGEDIIFSSINSPKHIVLSGWNNAHFSQLPIVQTIDIGKATNITGNIPKITRVNRLNKAIEQNALYKLAFQTKQRS